MLHLLHNRKYKVLTLLFLAVVAACSLNLFIATRIDQKYLESTALKLHGDSKFNPRASTRAVFKFVSDRIKHNSQVSRAGNPDGIYFHWDDWVDLSPADRILNRYRKGFPLGECDDIIEDFAKVNGYRMESYNRKVLRGMANLYCSKEVPDRIILTTDNEMIEVPVVGKRRMGYDSKPIKMNKQMLIRKMKKVEKSVVHSNFTTYPIKALQSNLDISVADFLFDPEAETFKLQEKESQTKLTSEESTYLEFLQTSSELSDHADKFFKYPWIVTDVVQGRSHHIAYPFFKRFIGDRERQSIIHHMIRAWFSFAETTGYASWIAHGSLLGWTYNGVNMPWDTDVDIQMPIVQIDKLGRYHNNSIIVENPRYGNGKYYLVVAPTYLKYGNGRNFIDARFIDINSGLYIDISAVQYTGDVPPNNEQNERRDLSQLWVHCKNWNWNSLDEILPLRHTYFEGGSAYIPKKVTQIMSRKYGSDSMSDYSFHHHNFQKDIDLWVPDEICSKPPKIKTRFNEHGGLSYKGACHSPVLSDEYDIVKPSADRHKLLNKNLDNPATYRVEEMGELPFLRKDAWDYFNDLNENLVHCTGWAINEPVVGKIYETGKANEKQ
ncbi:carbohydrate metabolism, cell wall maintenance [Scheffersomyces stipitis CBS 6054]|uniref:Carbohydrate metabolism, cell wall maintenance n=1 Tax=Scheffersomyces stipitis (strain ATCC 58785 / CBS 6054 / NBRC 10063 / NRRL Y-11545) TaxID=322104 RepID=A3LWY4_PICST|nr:carbohydrate metabolism, cell wall maintenance [Scheffersomyces stipitis CBS 6054]ABN67362.2 carbohydrate metabolism, cell wall maintenance [Scheffersomyces stipitis CBS 6054]